jgi:8-oxo-dGTP diphosphatase
VTEFKGAKLILFLGDRLVILRRDDKPDIPWPNHLDLPGGEREPGETVEDCVLRETFEEIGLTLQAEALIWSYQIDRDMIYAAHLPAERESDIVFGSEGQGWSLMSPQDYIDHPENIPRFARMIRLYLDQ